MATEPRQPTRLFHAIVLVGAALGEGSLACGPTTYHGCPPAGSDASADAAADAADAGVPCDPNAWPPTK